MYLAQAIQIIEIMKQMPQQATDLCSCSIEVYSNSLMIIVNYYNFVLSGVQCEYSFDRLLYIILEFKKMYFSSPFLLAASLRLW